MSFSAALHASPFKRSSGRGGFVVLEGASARRFLHFEYEAMGEARSAPPKLTTERYRDVHVDVLADPLV